MPIPIEPATAAHQSATASTAPTEGLTSQEAAARLEQFGPNEPTPQRRRSPVLDILRLFLNPLVMILLIAAVASAFLGEKVDAGIIIAIVAMSATVDFIQTYRSQQAIDQLRERVAPTATVLRDTKWTDIHRSDVVPGDAIGIDVTGEKLGLARQAGAVLVINLASESLHERLFDMTGGHGPDVVIEAVGTPATFRTAVEEVCYCGRVVYIGYAKEPVSYETKLFVQKELDILGSRNAQAQDFAAVISLLTGKRFPVDEAASTIIPLQDAPDVLRSWSENPSRFHKILVSLD